jgi:hypothetical protein
LWNGLKLGLDDGRYWGGQIIRTIDKKTIHEDMDQFKRRDVMLKFTLDY